MLLVFPAKTEKITKKASLLSDWNNDFVELIGKDLVQRWTDR